MKTIYIYDYLNKYGKAQYRKVEISDEEEEKWCIEDYKRRVNEANDSEKHLIQPRTLQDYMDELNRESYNQDRKQYRHRAIKRIDDDDDNELDIIDLYPSNELTPEENAIKEEEIKELQKINDNALSVLTEKQKRRVIKRFVEQKTLQQIADEEGVHYTVIEESIRNSLKKIKKYY